MLTTIRNFFHHVIEDFKALRRGERRVAPYGATGRIYQRKQGDAGTAVRIAATPKATLKMTITRANGTVEVIEVPATVLKVPNG